MPTGSCFCGKIKVEYSGEPAMIALCHCGDCRKIGGGMYSDNFVIPPGNFKVVEGTPKEISKIADTGKSITSCFCGDCGTTLFRYGDTFGGKTGSMILKAGILDDADLISSSKPTGELFTTARTAWVPAVEGAAQFELMPPS